MTNIIHPQCLSFLTISLIKESLERVKKAHLLTSHQHKDTQPEQLLQVLKKYSQAASFLSPVKSQSSVRRPWGASRAVECGEDLDCGELIRGSVSLLA